MGADLEWFGCLLYLGGPIMLVVQLFALPFQKTCEYCDREVDHEEVYLKPDDIRSELDKTTAKKLSVIHRI